MLQLQRLGRLAALAAFLLLPSAAAAQVGTCQALTSATPRLIPAAAEELAVRLTFIGHATFLVESPGGVSVATDYNDRLRPPATPDIATMNRAHSTHYSRFPDPDIKHVLRGWDPEGGIARHDLVLGDMRVRNVATNIRSWGGATHEGGNSIFVIETGGLCIAHLGHLHHTLTDEHLVDLGRIDVVLVPVDGRLTLDHAGMLEVIRKIGPRLVIPMHYFNAQTLNLFLAEVREDFEVEIRRTPELVLTRGLLPADPKVVVLPGPH